MNEETKPETITLPLDLVTRLRNLECSDCGVLGVWLLPSSASAAESDHVCGQETANSLKASRWGPDQRWERST